MAVQREVVVRAPQRRPAVAGVRVPGGQEHVTCGIPTQLALQHVEQPAWERGGRRGGRGWGRQLEVPAPDRRSLERRRHDQGVSCARDLQPRRALQVPIRDRDGEAVFHATGQPPRAVQDQPAGSTLSREHEQLLSAGRLDLGPAHAQQGGCGDLAGDGRSFEGREERSELGRGRSRRLRRGRAESGEDQHQRGADAGSTGHAVPLDPMTTAGVKWTPPGWASCDRAERAASAPSRRCHPSGGSARKLSALASRAPGAHAPGRAA